MRQKVLYKSVVKLLPEGETIDQLVYMMGRHRWSLPFAAGASALLFVVAWISGIEQAGGRVAIGLAGGAIAAMATTEYRVLVQTDEGLVLFAAGRLRQKATRMIGRLKPGTPIELIGTNLVVTEWLVGDRQFTVMRRFQQAMVALSS